MFGFDRDSRKRHFLRGFLEGSFEQQKNNRQKRACNTTHSGRPSWLVPHNSIGGSERLTRCTGNSAGYQEAYPCSRQRVTLPAQLLCAVAAPEAEHVRRNTDLRNE